MIRHFLVVSILFLTAMLCVQHVKAQYVEDALRLSGPTLTIGARSLGLGGAYSAISDDYTASYWNPAGLGQVHLNELSFGLSSLNFSNAASFYGSRESSSSSATNLNNIGLVYAVPATRGSLVFALGYGRSSEFTTSLSFNGFNPNSSIAQAYAPDGGTTDDPHGNLVWELYLANADSLGPSLYRWDSKIMDSVLQSGTVLEGGGQNYYSLSGAIEAAKGVYLGATADFLGGSYTYSRHYYEDDARDLYN